MNTTDYLLNFSNDDALAFITKNAKVSYGSFRRICARLIDELKFQGIEPGDRVAVWGSKLAILGSCLSGNIKDWCCCCSNFYLGFC